jgi:hypothetical protein
LRQLRPQLGHHGLAFSSDRDHPVCFEAESDQTSVSLGALFVQSRQGFLSLRRFDLQLLQRLARRRDLFMTVRPAPGPLSAMLVGPTGLL